MYLHFYFTDCLIFCFAKDKWLKVAIAVKNGSAGVHWTEDELKMKEDSLINSASYSAKQKSLLKRFFSTISDHGGPEVGQLSDILVDKFGDTRR